VNHFDLDALAERSGLKAPALKKSRLGVVRPVDILAMCVAAVVIGITSYGIVKFDLARASQLTTLIASASATDTGPVAYVKSVAPRLCSQRWPGTRELLISDGDLSASIACGNSKDRVIAGHVEVAYPPASRPSSGTYSF
jgi:hypothetical protein